MNSECGIRNGATAADEHLCECGGFDYYSLKMSVKVTYYLDVISSWCLWAEPAWLELKLRYAKAPVEFTWAIALIDESGMSKSHSP